MNDEIDLLVSNNVVTLTNGHLQTVEGLLPLDENSSFFYLAQRKLLSVYTIIVWLEEYHRLLDLKGVPEYAQNQFKLLAFPFIDNLFINNFKVCVIICGNPFDELISVPQIAVDLPQLASHLYVITYLFEENISEEQNNFKASVLGFVRHDQIHKHKLDIQYNEKTREYLIPFTKIESSFSALHTCVKYMQPERVLTLDTVFDSSSLHRKARQKLAEKILKVAAIEKPFIWSFLSLEIDDINSILSDANLQQVLAQGIINQEISNQQNESNEKQISHINFYKWFNQTIQNSADYLSDILTPWQFIGDFQDDELDITKDCIRNLLSSSNIPEDSCLLQSEKIKVGNREFQYTIAAWSTATLNSPSKLSILLLLVPISEDEFPENFQVFVYQENEILYEELISEYESNYQLDFEFDLRTNLEITFTYSEGHFTQLIFHESNSNLENEKKS